MLLVSHLLAALNILADSSKTLATMMENIWFLSLILILNNSNNNNNNNIIYIYMYSLRS